MNTTPLPATKTYGHRATTLDRVTATGKPVIGVLIITEARKEGLKARTRRYAVLELAPLDQPGRRFKLSKPLAERKAGEGEDNEHYVFLAQRGFDKCTCRGYLAGGKCSHMEILRAHARAGNLPTVKWEGEQGRPPSQQPAQTAGASSAAAAVTDNWARMDIGTPGFRGFDPNERKSWNDPKSRSPGPGQFRRRPLPNG